MTESTNRNAAVDRFLSAVRTGTGVPVELYAPTAVLDATVPNWRFTLVGPAAIAEEYARWFASPGAFEELERMAGAEGEMVRYLLTWFEHGVPHAAHHCHWMTFCADGRIESDVVFCGGRWDAAQLARMGETAR